MILNNKPNFQVSTILKNPRTIYVKRSENDSDTKKYSGFPTPVPVVIKFDLTQMLTSVL
jgi:hypothetical protein